MTSKLSWLSSSLGLSGTAGCIESLMNFFLLGQRERNRRKRKAESFNCSRSMPPELRNALAPISRGGGRSRRENLFDRKGRGTYLSSEALHETVRQCAV